MVWVYFYFYLFFLHVLPPRPFYVLITLSFSCHNVVQNEQWRYRRRVQIAFPRFFKSDRFGNDINGKIERALYNVLKPVLGPFYESMPLPSPPPFLPPLSPSLPLPFSLSTWALLFIYLNGIYHIYITVTYPSSKKKRKAKQQLIKFNSGIRTVIRKWKERIVPRFQFRELFAPLRVFCF